MAAVALTTGRQGIQRFRVKGGARPDTLYDALNCYPTISGSMRPRPGTVVDTLLPEGTIGLMTYQQRLHVFADHAVDMSGTNVGLSVLTHPYEPAARLVKIHFAEPFLGFPYVVAEWSNGGIYHYWLQQQGNWQANHVYIAGEVVQPATDNGYVYKATRLDAPNPTWEPGRVVQVGDILEPTVPNGYMYEVIDAAGDNPVTGASEPVWAAQTDALVFEDVTTGSSSNTDPSTAPPTVPPNVGDRYGNQGGSGGALSSSYQVNP